MSQNRRAQALFVNLPVRKLSQSITFFTALGFAFDPRFTDDSATCMVLGENLYAMLMVEERFRGYAPNPVSDARQTTEVLVALSLPDRAQVDELVQKAVAAGGKTYRAAEDHGFMYAHSFQDLDGHVWEVFHMDMDAFEQQRQAG